MKKLPNTKVMTCDKDSKWLYCSLQILDGDQK